MLEMNGLSLEKLLFISIFASPIIIYTVVAENSSFVKLFAPTPHPKKKKQDLFGCTATVFLNKKSKTKNLTKNIFVAGELILPFVLCK
jgi:hypothetical protein